MSKIIQPLGALDPQLGREQLSALADEHVRQIVEAGHYDLLKVYAELKRYDSYLSAVMDGLRDAALKQALAREAQEFQYGTTRVVVGKRTRYKYSADAVWQRFNLGLDEFKHKRKEREQWLRSLPPAGMEVIDEETGEVYTAKPPEREEIATLMVRL
jgi:hypothetical protein